MTQQQPRYRSPATAFDLAQVQQWLCSASKYRHFARRNGAACPLACYLNAVCGGKWFVESDGDYGRADARDGGIKDTATRYEAPAWAEEFVECVDDWMAQGETISAKEACTLIQRLSADSEDGAAQEGEQ